MGLFGPKLIPKTSYGYQPPPGATSHGWKCTNSDCRISNHEVVRRWPKACSGCGSPTDPLFDEPWEHEAEGIELQWTILHDPERDGGLTQDYWEVWQFKDALLRGDRAGIAQARESAQRYTRNKLSTVSWWFPGNVYFHYTWYGLKARDLAGTADDLLFWTSVSSVEDVENNNSNRTNARQVVDQADQFFQAGGASQPKAAQIIQGVQKIAEAAWPILNYPQQDAVKRMTRN